MSNLLTAVEITIMAADTQALLIEQGHTNAGELVTAWLNNPSTSQGLVFRGMTTDALAAALAQPAFQPMDDDDGAAQSDYAPLWSLDALRSALREGR